MPMFTVPGAIAAGGALSAAGGIFSGLMGAGAAGKQASAIRYGVDQSIQYAKEAEQRMRADLNPFMSAGQGAASILSDLQSGKIGISGQIMSNDPLYQWQQEEGQRNLNRQTARMGLTNSGAGLELNRRFQAQILGDESQRYMTNLQNTAAMGANAAAHVASNTTSLAQGEMQAQTTGAQGIGQANLNQGVAYGNIGTSVANAGSSAMGSYLNYNMFNQLIGQMNQNNPIQRGTNDYTNFSTQG